MSVPSMRVRWIRGVAIVAVGPNAAGEPVPPGVRLAEFFAGIRGVVLDLAGYDFISSEFLGELIRVHQAVMASGSRLRLCCPSGWVQEVLSTTKLDRVVPIFTTLAEALDDLESAEG